MRTIEMQQFKLTSVIEKENQKLKKTKLNKLRNKKKLTESTNSFNKLKTKTISLKRDITTKSFKNSTINEYELDDFDQKRSKKFLRMNSENKQKDRNSIQNKFQYISNSSCRKTKYARLRKFDNRFSK